jgi:SpoIID/LytB domain protein
VKNRYIGRTFIMPGQTQRKKSVRRKLNAISSEFKGKKVLLVDDSIVRGTTSEQIIQMAREAGAAKVYFASAAPEIRFPNVYGIDMPTANELIAHGREVEEVCKLIGADGLIFQDLEDLEEDRILEEIQIVKRDSAGYVETVQIGAETYSGDAVRYALGVPSPAFSLEEDGDEIRCVTYGRGHGYGLSQYGAGLMAENGSSADEILKHYFKNIQIVSE